MSISFCATNFDENFTKLIRSISLLAVYCICEFFVQSRHLRDPISPFAPQQAWRPLDFCLVRAAASKKSPSEQPRKIQRLPCLAQPILHSTMPIFSQNVYVSVGERKAGRGEGMEGGIRKTSELDRLVRKRRWGVYIFKMTFNLTK